MKKLTAIIILVLMPLGVVFAKPNMVSKESLINGVSDFLIDRAEANLMHAFEHKIKDSEEFSCYFPNTSKRLQYGHLQEWMLFPKNIWEQTIVKDVDLFALRSVLVNVEKRLSVGDKAAELANLYLESTQELELLFDGKRYPLSVVNKGTPEFEAVNGFSQHLGKIVSALNAFRPYTSVCDSPRQNLEEFKASISGLINITDNLKLFIDHVKKYGKDIRVSTNKLKEFCKKHKLGGDCSTEEKVSQQFVKKVKGYLEENFSELKLVAFVAAAKIVEGKVKNVVKEAEAKDTYTGMVMVLLDELEKTKVIDGDDFQRLSRSIMFFANISDSPSPDAVKAILTAYTLPPVSYYTKREHGYHVNLTAYLGLAWGSNVGDVPEPDESTSLFAPAGIELSKGLGNGTSLSIMISPFDFGYPVNQRLNGNDSDAKVEDILAPSITASYGFKGLPFTVGGGYQQGRYVPSLSESENRWLVFVAFDMPLFNLR